MPLKPVRRKLTAEQQELAAQWQYLPTHALGLMARRNPLVRKLWHTDPDMLDSAANHGLCIAASLFKPELGWKFSTYAIPVIMTQVNRELSAPFGVAYVPVGAWDSERTLEAARRAARRYQLDAVFQDEDGTFKTLPDMLAAPEPDDPPWDDELDQLREAMAKLPDLYRQTLELRYMEGLTLKQVSERMDGVCRERTRQRVEMALEMVRKLMKGVEG